MKKIFVLTNLHLMISVIIVVPAAVIYGFFINMIHNSFINFEVISNDLHNVFKAMMGLYLGFALLWLLAIFYKNLWFAATISNTIFMLGLGSGRIISFAIDGVSSPVFIIGTIGELFLASYGLVLLFYKKNLFYN